MTATPQQRLRSHLFAATTHNAFAVIDGASTPGLLGRLAKGRTPHACLFSGELHDEVKLTAPYVVQLLPGDTFSSWFIDECFGKHRGIFAIARAKLPEMRKHLRTFLRVRDPDGDVVFFRYYDPRVFRVYLPTLNQEEAQLVFGPVSEYVVEDGAESSTRYLRQGEIVAPHVVRGFDTGDEAPC